VAVSAVSPIVRRIFMANGDQRSLTGAAGS
jgi:hypothetical protein